MAPDDDESHVCPKIHDRPFSSRLRPERHPPHRARAERRPPQEAQVRGEHRPQQVLARDILRGGEGAARRGLCPQQLRLARWRFTASEESNQVGPELIISLYIVEAAFTSGMTENV